jgi:hypothetical protein
MAFSLGAIFYASKSLWLCALFHASVNAFSQIIVVDTNVLTVSISTAARVLVALAVVKCVKDRLGGNGGLARFSGHLPQ